MLREPPLQPGASFFNFFLGNVSAQPDTDGCHREYVDHFQTRVETPAEIYYEMGMYVSLCRDYPEHRDYFKLLGDAMMTWAKLFMVDPAKGYDSRTGKLGPEFDADYSVNDSVEVPTAKNVTYVDSTTGQFRAIEARTLTSCPRCRCMTFAIETGECFGCEYRGQQNE